VKARIATERQQVSVIIPSYNRRDSLLRLLHSLEAQTIDHNRVEVIVVDDGSEYDPGLITATSFSFRLHYERQTNQGATVARNHGASRSTGDTLVFIDDDITLDRHTLAALVGRCEREEHAIVLGSLALRGSSAAVTRFQQYAIAEKERSAAREQQHPSDIVPFGACNTQLLAIPRADFLRLGLLQDPSGGWPNWDDVDLGYRAHLAGYRLIQERAATGIHWDYAVDTLDTACQRWYRASQAAVRLFQLYPELEPHIPMYADKTPPRLGKDQPVLLARKLIRRLTARRLSLACLKRAVKLLELMPAPPALLAFLYRAVQGAYMVQGYDEGLQSCGLPARKALRSREAL